MKKILIVFCISLLSNILLAQSAIVPVGGTATGNGGTVTYTVGQVAVQRASGNNTFIIEGVQQPYEIQTVGVDDYPAITLHAIVYPNPTQHFVQLRISNYEMPEGGLSAQLFDANGKFLQQYEVGSMETKMDLEQYPSATYQLRIMDGNKLLKTFKVVKHNF